MSRRRHLNLDQLESFVAMADCGGMTAAAKKLNLSQPTISQHLQRLEMQLNRQLVTRVRGKALLTTEGERLLSLARGLLRLDERVGEQDAEVALRIGACSNIGVYLLPALLMGFRAQGHPLPQVSIASNPEIVRRLGSGELDIGLLEWWEDQQGLESQVWRREPLVVILPAQHSLAGQTSLTAADIASLTLLGGESGTGTGRLLRTHFSARAPLTVAMNLGSTEAVKRGVAAGLGASLVLRLSVDDLSGESSQALVVRPLIPEIEKPLFLVWQIGVSTGHALLKYLRGARDLRTP
jgi:DNA-binding transcriptional LysR family regulator